MTDDHEEDPSQPLPRDYTCDDCRAAINAFERYTTDTGNDMFCRDCWKKKLGYRHLSFRQSVEKPK